MKVVVRGWEDFLRDGKVPSSQSSKNHCGGILPSIHPQQHGDIKNAVMTDGTLKGDAIFAVTLVVSAIALEVMPLFVRRMTLASFLIPFHPGVPNKKKSALTTLACLRPISAGIAYPPVHGDSEHRILTPTGQNPFPGVAP